MKILKFIAFDDVEVIGMKIANNLKKKKKQKKLMTND